MLFYYQSPSSSQKDEIGAIEGNKPFLELVNFRIIIKTNGV
jgi:hypothetical protein